MVFFHFSDPIQSVTLLHKPAIAKTHRIHSSTISDSRAFSEREMGGHGESTTFKGITVHHPKRWQVLTGKGLCAVMWFWVLYRAKQDGPVVLGWRHPWEGHDDHSSGHGH